MKLFLVLLTVAFIGTAFGYLLGKSAEPAPNALITVQKNGYLVLHPNVTKVNDISFTPKPTTTHIHIDTSVAPINSIDTGKISGTKIYHTH